MMTAFYVTNQKERVGNIYAVVMRVARGAKNLNRPVPVTIASIGKPL